VHGKVLAVNDAGEWQAVEAFHEQVVHLLVVTLDHFLSEREILRHVSALVVSSQDYHVLRIVELKM
jgi:hypothetical protein